MSRAADGPHPHPLTPSDLPDGDHWAHGCPDCHQPVTWYIATPADGIIELSRHSGTPVNLAANIDHVIDHPHPCRTKWCEENGFSYFCSVKHAGEALEDMGTFPFTWPMRLWVVEPLGETSTGSQRRHPDRRLSHQIRVLEETDAHRALGSRGSDVLHLIQQEIPERAVHWAAHWDADPHGMREARRGWEHFGGRSGSSRLRADALAAATSRANGEEAAQTWLEHLARNAVDQALADTDAGMRAYGYAYRRATGQAVAAQHQDRLTAYDLDGLRGIDLDSPASATA
ncbi:hypothetical protein ACTWJ8_40200 (plasmid) [Streptomyces sp. SDT5-1]|uniref:hypothetical protein n=1 Tax=Streptomyces sp. SDT5-1 TaxID=3406418 RepID=UPI003FD19FF3